MLKVGLIILSGLLILSSGAWANGSDEAMAISTKGILIQKARLKLVAENVANVNTLKTSTGRPYQKKTALVGSDKNGVKLIGIQKSTAPFPKRYDPANPAADDEGFVYLPNVNLAEEMVDLSYTNILYDANLTAYKSAKSMYQQVIEILK